MNCLSSSNGAAFSDVDESSWTYCFIQIANENGLVSGYNDNSFKPSSSITRAEAMAITDRYIYFLSLSTFADNLGSVTVTSSLYNVKNGDKPTLTIDNNTSDKALKNMTYILQH